MLLNNIAIYSYVKKLTCITCTFLDPCSAKQRCRLYLYFVSWPFCPAASATLQLNVISERNDNEIVDETCIAVHALGRHTVELTYGSTPYLCCGLAYLEGWRHVGVGHFGHCKTLLFIKQGKWSRMCLVSIQITIHCNSGAYSSTVENYWPVVLLQC